MTDQEPELDGPQIHLNERERRLLELLRELGAGEALIAVEDGAPVLIEEMRKSITL